VECLEAGAEDFFLKPPDLDVLSLKVKRLIIPKQAETKMRGVHGSLSEMKPADFLQSLSTAEKNGEVRIERAKEKGTIFMQKGEVVHANTVSRFDQSPMICYRYFELLAPEKAMEWNP
jgi:DNA-binding response OmpR family regulator